MVWKRKNADSRWSRSFKGFKGAKQPEREVYLRTLANLTNPSEIRSLLQLGRKPYKTVSLTPDLLIFAKRILRPRYRNLSVIAASHSPVVLDSVPPEARGCCFCRETVRRSAGYGKRCRRPRIAMPPCWGCNPRI